MIDHISIFSGNQIDSILLKANKIERDPYNINELLDYLATMRKNEIEINENIQISENNIVIGKKQIIANKCINVKEEKNKIYIDIDNEFIENKILDIIIKKDSIFYYGFSENIVLEETDINNFKNKKYDFLSNKIEFYYENPNSDLFYPYLIIPNTFKNIKNIKVNNSIYDFFQQNIKYKNEDYTALRLKEKIDSKNIMFTIEL